MGRRYEGHGDPGGTAAGTPGGTGRESSGSYTGIILIHGLGDIKRNSTLQQVTNSVTYWLNHVAGLTLRPEGAGRVWLTSDLTDDPNPDAPASRATIELEAPAGQAGAGEDPSLRLEVREVWWAEAFGLPKVTAAIRWARIQFREEAAHLLLPIGKKAAGPARLAARRPARQTPQALTYRPNQANAAPDSPEPTGEHARLNRLQRALTGAALRVYAVLQYVWKATQWLALTPLITLLLLLMGPARLLAVIPLFRGAIITGFTKLTNYIMLHWISSMQVYLLDYTRSASMRQRFEREVEAFLQDPGCERIVVIAHSMGTVISYEGLTTVLGRPEAQSSTKPITYICLAQALRRIWLLETADPHRVRGVLPERVRWLHFWARYDPVTAGPLEPRSLPRPSDWAEGWTREDYMALQAGLERCENVDVVNTDGTLTDHNAYWNNLEQVVGPVVKELVAGHPALERLVVAHQATKDDILMRRWGVAWRATVSLLGGLAAGVGIILWDHFGGGVGHWVENLLLNIPWHDIATAVCSTTCGQLIPPGPPHVDLTQLYYALVNGGVVVPLLLLYIGADPIFTLATAVAATGVAMVLIARLVTRPTPFAFRAVELVTSQSRKYVFVLAMAAIVLVTVASFINSNFFHDNYVHTSSQFTLARLAYIWALGLAQVTGTVAFVVAVFQAAQRGERGWVVALPLSWLVLVSNHFDFGIALLALAVAGCLLTMVDSVRNGQWGWVVAVLAVLLMLVYTSLGYQLPEHLAPSQYPANSPLVASGVVYVDPYLPILLYALWAGPLQVVPHGRLTNILRGALIVALLALVLDEVYSLLGHKVVYSRLSSGSRPTDAIVDLALAAGAVGAVAWGLSLLDAAQGRRWGWLVVLVAVAALGTAAVLAGLLQFQPVAALIGVFAAMLIYALWSRALSTKSVHSPLKT